jgi:beta-propeller repeat-containing protein
MRRFTASYLTCLGVAASLALTAVVVSPARLLGDPAIGRTSATQASQRRLAAAYGKLPLSFELNQGQADGRVRFLSRGSGYALFLTGNEAVLTLHKGSPTSKFAGDAAGRRLPMVNGRLQAAVFKPAGADRSSQQTTTEVLRMRLIGANAQAKISGLEQLPGRSNYFIGKDPAKWHTNLPNYARVKYAKVYPGVDLVYYGNQRQLEYDFVLAPGADPSQIKLSFNGAQRLQLDAGGDLIVSIAGSEIIEHKPVIYQDLDSIRRRVAGGYALRSSHTVGFKLGAYDAHRSLTIDPALVYSTYLGGGFDAGSGIAADAAGNAYVTGHTDSRNFPVTPGALQTTLGGDADAFVSKFSLGLAIPFAEFGGHLRIDPGTGVFLLNGGFTLGSGGSINPHTEQVSFSVGNYSLTVPVGSFAANKSGYVYQKKLNNIFLCLYIRNTSTPGTYILLVKSGRGALTGTTTNPVPVALTIGDNFGNTQMKAKFD